MAYGRLTIVRPRRGEEQRAADLVATLAAFYQDQEGCVTQYCLVRRSDSRVYKVGIWRDRQCADTAARLGHSLALRSQILLSTAEHPEELALDVVESGGPGREAHRPFPLPNRFP